MRLEDELERLRALAGLSLLDTPPEGQFDEITRLASTALGTESAAISLIDARRQWFKSRVGIPFTETPREHAFCTYPMASQEFFEVSDASLDPRFADNPLVTGAGGIRFYAGAPLVISSGHCLGTLCVFDPAVRPPLSTAQRQALSDLAALAVERIEGRRDRRLGEITARVMDAVADAILCVDGEGLISYWNRAAEQMFGHSAARMLGCGIDCILPEEARKSRRCRSWLRSLAAGSERAGRIFEMEAQRASSEHFPIELSIARWSAKDEDTGRPRGYAAIIRDVSARKQQERDSAQTRRFLDTIVNNLPAMLFVKDSRTRRYQLLNRAGEDLIGVSQAEVVGRTDRELFPDVGDAYHDRDGQVLAIGGIQSYESDFTRADGAVVRLRTKRIVVDGPDGPGQFILGMSEDVTGIREAEARILHLAHFDSLTGLYNRASFLDGVERLVQAGQAFAILTIDLDRFKAINDQFGHLAGDEVLVEVGNRLRQAAPGVAQLARIGGDEFTALLVGVHAEQARRIAEALVRSLGSPYRLDRFEAHTGASIGVVCFPENGRTVSDLRQAADLAMYRAKSQGGATACFFSPEMDLAARDRRMLERNLRRAIEAHAVHVVYQPVVSTATGQTTSFEALARWTHPERGPVPPDLFISIAEECGLVGSLGTQVLESACRDAAGWRTDIRVAVNLSPIQFEAGDLVSTVRSVLDRTGLAPNRLQLEVTEGLVIRDVDRVFAILEQLRALGIQILMDDFGVGYSSLSYFERFPFDKVKIDRSFVAKMLTSRASAAVIEAVVGLGRSLDMGVVAEGVETEAQMEALVAAGCSHLQGYLISRPRPAADFGHILAAQKPSPAGRTAAAL